MTSWDDPTDDMASPHSAASVDRLLSGAPAPDDPAVADGVGRLLAALRSPTTSDGAGEREAVASIAASVRAAPTRLDACRAADAMSGLVHRKIDGDACDRQRMAERHQLRGPLRALDRGDPGDADDVALLRSAADDHPQRRRLHADLTAGHGDAMGFLLRADVDHVSLSVLVEMRQG